MVGQAGGHGRHGVDDGAELAGELGPAGEAYLTELVHAWPFTWKSDVERLFALLEELGEERFLRLLQRALFQRLYGAEYVVRIAAEVAS